MSRTSETAGHPASMNRHHFLCAICLLLYPASGIQSQELPKANVQYGGFAFPDRNDTRLLADSDLPQPETFHDALCSDGRRYSVRFEKKQVESSTSNGRRFENTFDQAQGSVFTVLQGRMNVDLTCFLASALTAIAL